MTVFENGGGTSSSTPGSRSRATSTSASTWSCPTSRTSQRQATSARSCSRTRTRITSARCRTCCARCGCREVWATRLTLGLVKSKLDEHGLLRAAELREIGPEGGAVELGPFRLEFVRMAHSVPDAVAIVIETDAGRVFHTGDWKLDHTPVDGLRTDVGRLAELGNRGVDLMLGDSTNAERPGFTGSERLVGEAFRQIIPVRQGRVLVASFASNVHRMQQAIDVAVEPAARSRSSAARCART